ncbi:MAG: phosphomannomutase [Paracoccaceae bacterium]
MSPKFGTSGLRGLVEDLTDGTIGSYVDAFLAACETGGAVHLGRDRRDSSARIAEAVAARVLSAGLDLHDCGAVPTPALAMRAMAARQAAIMVTGSHVPSDRNGLKFYVPDGEITKGDEGRIVAALGAAPTPADSPGTRLDAPEAGLAWAARGAQVFGPDALSGLRVGLWQHSSVARDLLVDALAGMGAEVVSLDRAEAFVPVDTEALSQDLRARLAAWSAEHRLDALVSTDGDGDRPLLADASGQVVPGDVLGVLCARALEASRVVTPISSNSMVEAVGFAGVTRTRIGSPHVIAAMEDVLADRPNARVVGFEANGGFILGFDARGPAGRLAPLMTRDSLLPLLAVLWAARAAGGVAALMSDLPARATATALIRDVAAEDGVALIERLTQDEGARAGLLTGPEAGIDSTDGLRATLEDGRIVHLRPSGNAPEFRVYAEAETEADARALCDEMAGRVAEALAG